MLNTFCNNSASTGNNKSIAFDSFSKYSTSASASAEAQLSHQ